MSRSLIEEPLSININMYILDIDINKFTLGSPAMELSPVLELSLSCRDLYCPSGIGHLNTFCALSVMTPPQSAWSKHAQTEVVEVWPANVLRDASLQYIVYCIERCIPPIQKS